MKNISWLLLLLAYPVFGQIPGERIKEQPDFARTVRLNTVTVDSLVFKVWARQAGQWKKILLVSDWTGSMYPHTIELMVWLKQAHLQTEFIKRWVFFNDGDRKPLGEKVLGQTGGIYHTDTSDFESVLALMQRVQAGGQGGDTPENVIEALLYGQAVCPDCEDVVLIADSGAAIRDLLLHPQLQAQLRKSRQILHIILCGKEQNIVADYLDLAFHCQASLHTAHQDWHGWQIGTVIQIGRFHLKVTANGLETIPKKKKK